MKNFDDVVPRTNIVYYSDDHSKSQRCTSKLANTLGCTYTLPNTWVELTRELEFGETHVALHYNFIKKSEMVIEACVSAIRLLTRFTPDQQFVKIMILITPHTERRVVDKIMSMDGVYLGLDMNYYSVEDTADATRAFVNGKKYSPNHIIDQLPTAPVRLKSIYFLADHATYVTTQMIEQFKSALDMDMIYCANWIDVGPAFEQNPHQLVFHIGMLDRLDVTITEIVSMLETKIKLVGLEIPIGVAIERDTTLSTIKELKQAGVSVIVPSAATWGVEETVQALKALRDRHAYCPAHIIKQLPGNRPKVVRAKNNDIQLTLRQGQVLDLIKNRGASNKVIAKMLKISESTVKLHITAVLKKYGAKNRTQLALFANKEKDHA